MGTIWLSKYELNQISRNLKDKDQHVMLDYDIDILKAFYQDSQGHINHVETITHSEV
jgi:hypothetical protein